MTVAAEQVARSAGVHSPSVAVKRRGDGHVVERRDETDPARPGCRRESRRTSTPSWVVIGHRTVPGLVAASCRARGRGRRSPAASGRRGPRGTSLRPCPAAGRIAVDEGQDPLRHARLADASHGVSPTRRPLAVDRQETIIEASECRRSRLSVRSASRRGHPSQASSDATGHSGNGTPHRRPADADAEHRVELHRLRRQPPHQPPALPVRRSAELGDAAAGIWLLLGSVTGYMGLLELGLVPALAQSVAVYRSRGDIGRAEPGGVDGARAARAAGGDPGGAARRRALGCQRAATFPRRSSRQASTVFTIAIARVRGPDAAGGVPGDPPGDAAPGSLQPAVDRDRHGQVRLSPLCCCCWASAWSPS